MLLYFDLSYQVLSRKVFPFGQFVSLGKAQYFAYCTVKGKMGTGDNFVNSTHTD